MARFAGTAMSDYFNTPDFTAISGTNMKGQSMQRNAATKAEGLVHGAGINSMAQVKGAGFKADALIAQGQAQGQAAMMSGLASGISGIAGGFGAMGSGGGGGGYVTPGGIETGMSKSHFAPTQSGVNHFNLSTGFPGGVAPRP